MAEAINVEALGNVVNCSSCPSCQSVGAPSAHDSQKESRTFFGNVRVTAYPNAQQDKCQSFQL
eukprot:scaffold54842_cov30-Attheya_sp.AAC.3